MKVVFPYLAQIHQIPHTLPIAMEMARGGGVEVHLAASTEGHLAYMRQLAAAAYPGVPVTFKRLYLPWAVHAVADAGGWTIRPKKLTLLLNLSYLRSFNAIVVPERTSLFLRRFDMGRTRLVWTGHGGGDRASGYTDNVGQFDFVLLPGEKLATRHKAAGNIRDGHYGIGGYAKFDLVGRLAAGRKPLFDNGRPTVVYNPHFWPSLSSWHLVGFEVLDFFANQSDYNLVFAPHMRVFDPPTAKKYEPFRRYMDLPHMRIDLGSAASTDMTYTGGADIYLGDVSSQIAEFTLRPRPLVFLDPRRTAWRDDPNYRSWQLGIVAETVAELPEALKRARETHREFRQLQADYFAETFDVDPTVPSAPRGAKAILDYLRTQA
ncbi:sensor domain-containing protein [Aureimonas leprariae]|uniref:Sensor domain-containing protein n=1 Tax=Plantimonas leprariae TaxID=2615207 RepID=A0A7V7PLM2_9HYPH|nr:sensor domain-containing protein [Aureimonas leprariae]KAB0677185.1 sensor domain-containing protein [Aureimonas leprariae]